MNRKRRVEIRIEHTEISIFSGGGPVHSPGNPVHPAPANATGLLQASHPFCPTCGSAELVLLTDAVFHPRLNLAALNQGMRDGTIHAHRSPSGQWWICAKSLPQF